MAKNRDVTKSVMAWVRSTLLSPPASSELSAFNVYTLAQMELAGRTPSAFTPVQPYCFVIDAYSRPIDAVTPMVVVEWMKTTRAPFELGNRNGHSYYMGIHVFGRNKNERDDLSDLFADNLPNAFTINHYNTSGSIVSTEIGLPDDEIDTEPFLSRGGFLNKEDVRKEGTVDLWNLVSFVIRTKS